MQKMKLSCIFKTKQPNTFDIQDIELPIDLNYEIFTSKTNFHDSININGDEYLNVFEEVNLYFLCQ